MQMVELCTDINKCKIRTANRSKKEKKKQS